jgi:hypothetical protein
MIVSEEAVVYRQHSASSGTVSCTVVVLGLGCVVGEAKFVSN